MTTRNFRVNTGLSVGDIAVVASTNAVTGISSITLDNSTAPAANARRQFPGPISDTPAAVRYQLRGWLGPTSLRSIRHWQSASPVPPL